MSKHISKEELEVRKKGDRSRVMTRLIKKSRIDFAQLQIMSNLGFYRLKDAIEGLIDLGKVKSEKVGKKPIYSVIKIKDRVKL